MIINKSGITIRIGVENLRTMGRATQGVRIINLEKRNDRIASVCKVNKEEDIEEVEEISEENTEFQADASDNTTESNTTESTEQQSN